MLVLTFCNDEDLEVSGEAVRLEDASAAVENLVTGPAGIRPVVPEMHCCEEELILLVVASLIPVGIRLHTGHAARVHMGRCD